MHDEQPAERGSRARARDPIAWHLSLVVAVSTAYESLFVHHGIAWLFDEGWPLYAAMRLHAGGVLYQDAFFVFPPGHLLPAFVAYAIDPPGIVLARIFYAGFNVALCASMYLLGRRVMRPHFALLAALLVAVAAPRAHLSHLVFGYRYLVFSVWVLLAFAQRLGRPAGDAAGAVRWMLVAGVLTGVALYFRLTPAFAVACAVAVGLLATGGGWRVTLRDAAAYAAGVCVVALPVLAWLGAGAGLDAAWREAVVRPLVMTDLQSLDALPLSVLPEGGSRRDVYRWSVALQQRGFALLFAVYFAGLAAAWLRARRAGRPFERALLLAVTTWGGVFLARSLGRADDHHVMTALPPAFLLLAHALDAGCRTAGARVGAARATRVAATAVLFALLFAASGYAQRIDLYLSASDRGDVPVASTGGAIRVASKRTARSVDRVVATIARATRPGDSILDVSSAPLFYVLTERFGPGFGDVVSPGSFSDAAEEERFVERLRRVPPAAVVWPRFDFDDVPARSVERTAPVLSSWVRANYDEHVVAGRWAVLLPREPRGPERAPGAAP